jgi:alpha-amylase
MSSQAEKTRLVFALHFHQPFGNLPEVFADAAARCYLPTIELLTAHPGVKMAIHVSGSLLEWAEAHQPALIDGIGELVARGQVEILGGGDQEPMLAILPQRDASGQLLKMAERCERLFGVRPDGMWLAERVWEPDLARLIAGAAYRYTFLDDTHLRAAGVAGEPGAPLDGYYVTDKAGASCCVLPIDRGLRERIPFADVPDLMGYLHRWRGKLLSYGDDVEKFGLWPTTQTRVWQQGWLASMLSAFDDAGEWLQTVHPRDLLDTDKPRAQVYIPTISYAEMGSWMLPPALAEEHRALSQHLTEHGMHDRAEAFLRGGIWQGFLAKYPESNLIYRKMLRASAAVESARQAGAADLEAMQNALYRGQCNCAYWHGLFGGLYMQHLRSALMSSLIEAEDLARPRTRVAISMHDHDGDLQTEVLLEGPAMNAYIDPSRGGRVFELDLRAARFHLTGVMARRRENYHHLVAQAQVLSDEELINMSAHNIVRATEHGLVDKLVVDRYPRGAFVDHLLASDTTREDFDRDYAPVVDFANADYRVGETAIREQQAVAELRAQLDGYALDKTITLSAAGCSSADYLLASPEGSPELLFATELDFTLLSPDNVGGRQISCLDPEIEVDPRPGAGTSHDDVRALRIDGGALGFAIRIDVEPAATLWRIPIETVSQSERGFESAYQGTALVFLWRVAAGSRHFESRIRVALA